MRLLAFAFTIVFVWTAPMRILNIFRLWSIGQDIPSIIYCVATKFGIIALTT